MDTDEQVLALRNKYLEEVEKVYDSGLQMKLMSVMVFNKSQYEQKLKSIEVISSIIEGAVSDRNPKRLLRYIVMLRKVIERLVLEIDKDYKRLWDNRLTQ